jgi:hypothetical protein
MAGYFYYRASLLSMRVRQQRDTSDLSVRKGQYFKTGRKHLVGRVSWREVDSTLGLVGRTWWIWPRCSLRR